MEQSFFKRESAVVTDGVAPGLEDAVTTTWSDLKQAKKDFAADPVKTTETFLENHWQDAAVGAAITLANPRGLANVAMMAYATRGLWGSTASALIEAGDANTDMTRVTRDLRQAVSHEGTAFLSSMPLAMVGGMAGKGAANAVFGKDMGAFDMVTGKVSSADVKANLWNIADTMKPPKLKLLVTDIDGTVGAFTDYFAPAVRENVARLSAEHNVSETEIYQKIGGVMDKYRSHDYPWSLEQSGLAEKFNMTPEQFTTEVVEPFWKHMDERRSELLKPFDGVPETLDTLRANGVRIMARSDAPYYIGLARLHTMDLANKMDEFYALETPPPNPISFTDPKLMEHGARRVADFMAAEKPFEQTKALSKADEKPHLGNLQERMTELNVRPSQTAMFGDSRIKDGGLAEAAGIKFFYAKFGAHPPTEYQNIFAKLASGRDAGPTTSLPDTMAPPKKVYPPIYRTAASYSEVLDLLQPKRDWSAITSGIVDNALVRPSFKPLAAYSLPVDRSNDR
jgi:phosphoglycolate phosphatase-like HAD superfamily hydrolase